MNFTVRGGPLKILTMIYLKQNRNDICNSGCFHTTDHFPKRNDRWLMLFSLCYNGLTAPNARTFRMIPMKNIEIERDECNILTHSSKQSNQSKKVQISAQEHRTTNGNRVTEHNNSHTRTIELALENTWIHFKNKKKNKRKSELPNRTVLNYMKVVLFMTQQHWIGTCFVSQDGREDAHCLESDWAVDLSILDII